MDKIPYGRKMQPEETADEGPLGEEGLLSERLRKEEEANRTKQILRRRLLAHGLEALAAAPLVWFGWRTAANKLSYYGIKDKVMHTLGNAQAQAQDLQTVAASAASSARSVYSTFYDNFHKSRTEVYPVSDADGNVTIQTRIVYYWDVPKGLPNEGVVEDLDSSHSKVSQALGRIMNLPIFSWKKHHGDLPVAFGKQDAAEWTRGVASCAGYGIAMLGLLYYEEILNKMNGFDHNYKMTRRNAFKCLAMLVGGSLAFGQKERAEKSLEDGRARLEETTRRLMDEVSTMNDHAAFTKAVGMSPSAYLSAVQHDMRVARQLQQSPAGSVIEPAKNLEKHLMHAESMAKSYCDNPKKELAEAMRLYYATRELNAAVSSEALRAGSAPFKELGLCLAGVLGVLVPYEIYTAAKKND